MSSLSPEISPAHNATTPPPPSITETTPNIPTSPPPPPPLTSESPPPVPQENGNIPTGTLVGMITGIGIGGISMLVAVVTFMIFYKRWKRKKMREQGFGNYNSEAPPQDKKSEPFKFSSFSKLKRFRFVAKEIFVFNQCDEEFFFVIGAAFIYHREYNMNLRF